MTEQKPGFIAQVKSYPAQFWVVNTMEIFERMSWYGWFTVMALYVTGTTATGGLGFSTELRGALQGIVPFFLYMLPVVTGALADRYGYKKMFIIAYLVMIVAYYLLGQFSTVPTFFAAFMFVAVGAAIFKPVIVGTVARVTNESNSAMGFGIFYMMVNIGGFCGPIVAGLVRGQGWEWVFVACSAWAGINLIIVLAWYKEPAREGVDAAKRSLRQVGDNMVEVLGNLRFFITVFAVLFALMFANLNVGPFRHFSWTMCAIFVPCWFALNFTWDALMPPGSGNPKNPASQGRNFLAKRMHCSNWRFALFLLIMSGFWTSFNQIFYTMPEYIRDFVDTRPVIRVAEAVFGESDPDDPTKGIASKMATINVSEREVIVLEIERLVTANQGGTLDRSMLEEASKDLLASKIRLGPDELRALLADSILQDKAEDEVAAAAVLKARANKVADRVIIAGRQVNPEYIVNLNALGIVLFQVLVSFLMARFHRFTTMIIGMLIASVGIGLSMFAGTEGLIGSGGLIWIVAGGIFVFSFGEMMASPTSQEYVGRIAPADKKALYMGYYFVAVALGNLFGGILSGELMAKLAYEMNRPDLMWMAFGAIMLATSIVFLLYNRFALPKGAADKLMGADA
ncbi:MAG: MFS transporter [Planctomycetes bacterium]|nr:MFS transporter [Planctomycetota bacterium]